MSQQLTYTITNGTTTTGIKPTIEPNIICTPNVGDFNIKYPDWTAPIDNSYKKPKWDPGEFLESLKKESKITDFYIKVIDNGYLILTKNGKIHFAESIEVLGKFIKENQKG